MKSPSEWNEHTLGDPCPVPEGTMIQIRGFRTNVEWGYTESVEYTAPANSEWTGWSDWQSPITEWKFVGAQK